MLSHKADVEVESPDNVTDVVMQCHVGVDEKKTYFGNCARFRILLEEFIDHRSKD